MYVKDLRVLGRDLKDVALVDNAAYSYAFQLDNGIPILPYYHGSHDYELKALEKFIVNSYLSVSDVRSANRKTFGLHKYRNYYGEPERLVEELYMNEEVEENQKRN
jgi:CTD small phosphatase-like protein 2